MMKKISAALATLGGLAASALAAGENRTPDDISDFAQDLAVNVLPEHVAAIAGVLTVGFGIVIAFWAYGKIKKGVNKAG